MATFQLVCTAVLRQNEELLQASGMFLSFILYGHFISSRPLIFVESILSQMIPSRLAASQGSVEEI